MTVIKLMMMTSRVAEAGRLSANAKMPSILSSDAYLLKFATKNVVFLRIFKGVMAAVSVFVKVNQTANTGTAMLSTRRGLMGSERVWQMTGVGKYHIN